jgi:hypothetical protein
VVNPAAEDQAADRAHRIGTDRPVTILRLLAQSIVEEQVAALHKDKRQLAQDLLQQTGARRWPSKSSASFSASAWASADRLRLRRLGSRRQFAALDTSALVDG